MKPNSTINDAEPKTLGKMLGEIVGVAVVEQLKEGRWYMNWRTLDERDQWTANDFYQLKWPDDAGTISGMVADIVIAIKPKVTELANDQVASTLREVLSRLPKQEPPFHLNSRAKAWNSALSEVGALLNSMLQELEK